ncbi:unnamed protein product [Protopolystoma xenopodis]|uniref:Uncharacterized protein n=1 Tax=Protopolystoma xenopodis TaxID=117903 RepID=A0A3S5CHR5_9PLAT|nr:unnamed protein product [Protopolystoma xenopodis]
MATEVTSDRRSRPKTRRKGARGIGIQAGAGQFSPTAPTGRQGRTVSATWRRAFAGEWGPADDPSRWACQRGVGGRGGEAVAGMLSASKRRMPRNDMAEAETRKEEKRDEEKRRRTSPDLHSREPKAVNDAARSAPVSGRGRLAGRSEVEGTTTGRSTQDGDTSKRTKGTTARPGGQPRVHKYASPEGWTNKQQVAAQVNTKRRAVVMAGPGGRRAIRGGRGRKGSRLRADAGGVDVKQRREAESTEPANQTGTQANNRTTRQRANGPSRAHRHAHIIASHHRVDTDRQIVAAGSSRE